MIDTYVECTLYKYTEIGCNGIESKAKEILIYIQSKGIPIPGVLAKRIEQMDDEKQITIDNRLSDIENKINPEAMPNKVFFLLLSFICI